MVNVKVQNNDFGEYRVIVFPDAESDFVECRDTLRRLNKSYCDFGFLTLSQNIQIINNIPVFVFDVDSTTIPLNQNSDNLYVSVDCTEAVPHVILK